MAVNCGGEVKDPTENCPVTAACSRLFKYLGSPLVELESLHIKVALSLRLAGSFTFCLKHLCRQGFLKKKNT